MAQNINANGTVSNAPTTVGNQTWNPWLDPSAKTQQQQLANPNLVDLRGKTNAAGSGVGGTVANSWTPPPPPKPAAPQPAPSMFQGMNTGFQQYQGAPVQMRAQPSPTAPQTNTAGSNWQQYQPAQGFTPGGSSGDSFGRTPVPGVSSGPFLTNTGVPGSYGPQIQPSMGGGTFATNQAGGSGVFQGVNQILGGGTQIDPNNSLRTQQFLPGGTGNAYDQMALNALQGAQVPSEFSPLVGESRNMIMDRLRGLSGPDRTSLAKEAFDIFQRQNEPRYQQELRGVGQKAAALGRVGAGLTTNELTDVWSQRNRDLDLMQRGLINDAAGQTLQDRLNTLQGTLAGSSTLEGQDFGRASQNAQLALQRAGQLGGMGQNEFNRGQALYGQNAQERAYQDYLARTAVEDRIRQQQMQQQQANTEWERQYRANQLAAQLAGQQQTQFPSTQPAGNSYATGQSAGAQAPTYSSPAEPWMPPAQMEPWTPPPTNPGLGLADPRTTGNWQPPGIFDQGIGYQNNQFDAGDLFNPQRRAY